mmetsp:Transcript_29332/g.5298  ORF Transcript_29332/g.5298 Transcript_29332/m.5298 type:complete len:102 (+) Transcript_29332:1426-1731(+)
MDENSRLRSLKTHSKDNISFISDEKFNKTYEDKHSILLKEKKDLEKLINRFINALPIAVLQKIFSEMIKTRGEIEILERERDRIEKDLMHAEGEMRSKARS